MSRHRPAEIFLSCASGGVPSGVFGGRVLAELEASINEPISNLINGAFVSSSGSTILSPVLIRNPNDEFSPLFTAQKSFEIFKQECPVWVSDKINAAIQLISSYGLKIPFNKHAFHYDREKISASIHNQIGNATLQDMMVSYYVSAHSLTAQRARDAAILYHKTIMSDGDIRYAPSADTMIKDLILGTTAVPGLFKSTQIGNDFVCDFGHMDDADRALIRFQKSRPKDTPIHFIAIGPPRYHGQYTPSFLDRIGIVRQSLHLARSTSHHSYSSTLGLCEDLLGEDFVHDLSIDIDVGKTPHPNSLRSILDASPRHIADLEDMAHKYLVTDAFKRARDFMGENFHARSAPPPELPAVLAQQINIKKPHAGILSSMRSFIFGAIPGSPALH